MLSRGQVARYGNRTAVAGEVATPQSRGQERPLT
jgi:hypothetical protein